MTPDEQRKRAITACAAALHADMLGCPDNSTYSCNHDRQAGHVIAYLRGDPAAALAIARVLVEPLGMRVETDCCSPGHEYGCDNEEKCDEPGCTRRADCGWPTPERYRRTCGPHMQWPTVIDTPPLRAPLTPDTDGAIVRGEL